jgi:hypothetical protein|tara:strand:+ start:680 stop:793 length:114 start_codon:yes stop_codon:yes gene_type:complete
MSQTLDAVHVGDDVVVVVGDAVAVIELMQRKRWTTIK